MMEKKKIALIGNMNNNFNAFCKHLRKKGIDAHLFLLKGDYFLPKDDSFSDDWKQYTHQLDWGPLNTWTTVDFKAIKEQFESYDLTIGCDTVPAFFNKAKITLDVFVPYGFDLYNIPFYLRLIRPINFWYKALLIPHQRKGIRKTREVFMAPTGGILETHLKKIAPKANVYRGWVPMVFLEDYFSEAFEKAKETSNVHAIIHALKKQNKTIIFHSSRHYWKTTRDLISIKSNDLLFKGLRKYIDESNNKTNFHIVTFEYGTDVEHSKNLIKELQLEKYVTWLPKSPRKEVMIGLSSADLIVGELFHSFFTYGIIYEALALKKLIVHKREDHLYEKYYDKLYEMCYSDSEESIAEVLNKYESGLLDKDQMTEQAYNWFIKNLINEPVNKVLSMLN